MLFRVSTLQRNTKHGAVLVVAGSVLLCLVSLQMWILDNEVDQQRNPIDVFVASVHAANFNNPLRPYAVFLNTMLPDTPRYEWRRRQQLSFRCISDKNEVADAEYRDSDGGTDCSWKNYYFVCEFTKPALSVRLVDQEGFGPRVLVKQPVTGEIPLVACLSRTFYYENWQVMLTVLEMYKAMGVSELSIHILNIVKEVFDILKQYEDEINLKIHPGFLIPKIRGRSENPNFQTETMNQIMCYNDCLYNYREAADFLIFTDMDDLIIPENGDLLTKARQILQRFPLAASMEFAWTTSNFNGVAHPNQFSIPRLLSGVTHHVEAYGKSTVIPKRMLRAIIHNTEFYTARIRGFSNVNANRTAGHGLTLHMREMVMMSFNESLENDHSIDQVNLGVVDLDAMKRADNAFRKRMNGKFKDEDDSDSNNLEEKSKTLQRLKEELKRDEKLNADFKSLAEQLQNERATVSRAVAQNIDLKEQLGELRDRLVEVTNRCAEQEDERQRAVAMVKNLSRRLEEMDSNGSQSMNEVQKQAYDLPIVPELLEKHIESMGYLSEDHNRQLIDISKAIKRIIKKYHPHTAAEELDQLTELPDIIVNRLQSHHHQHNGTVPPPPTPKNDASTMVDQDLAKNLPSPAVLETALQTAAKEALETEEMEVNNEQHEKTVDREDEDQVINENSQPESSQYIENPNYYGTPQSS